MMYAFAARPDFRVMDEPFYAAYLATSGIDHPMREAILASQPTDPQAAAAMCSVDGAPHVYQKHMIHHMLPDMPRGWTAGARHVFLVRHPARVVASYGQKRQGATVDDLGFTRQLELHDWLVAEGHAPVVISSEGTRADPQAALTKLCAALGLPFDAAMLSWPAGGIREDGVWASHWYGAIHASTGFAGPEGDLPELSAEAADLAAAGMDAYEALAARAVA
jgi:hypothetical protein